MPRPYVQGVSAVIVWTPVVLLLYAYNVIMDAYSAVAVRAECRCNPFTMLLFCDYNAAVA